MLYLSDTGTNVFASSAGLNDSGFISTMAALDLIFLGLHLAPECDYPGPPTLSVPDAAAATYWRLGPFSISNLGRYCVSFGHGSRCDVV